MSLLQVSNIHTYFDRVHAVKGLSLTVELGEIVALIGGNGAGKSTTLNTISGLARPRVGKIDFLGQDITRLAAHEIVEAGLLQVPEGRRVFSTLTVDENLDMGAFARTDRARIVSDKEDVFKRFPILLERRKQLAGTFSGGEQQMLAIARALITNPTVLLMDEPSEGLAPVVVEQLVAAIHDLVGGRTLSVLLVEQRVDIALDLASRCIVMDRGRIVRDAPSSDYRTGIIDMADMMGLERRA